MRSLLLTTVLFIASAGSVLADCSKINSSSFLENTPWDDVLACIDKSPTIFRTTDDRGYNLLMTAASSDIDPLALDDIILSIPEDLSSDVFSATDRKGRTLGHIAASEAPDLSLGVVAFSKAQSDTLTEALEYERRRDPVLDAFLREGRAEDVFVKNIENVQGDERDVILISVGYGPQEPNGRLAAMSFGPVNGEGGERRLNVLFSRARVRCEILPHSIPATSTQAGHRARAPAC